MRENLSRRCPANLSSIVYRLLSTVHRLPSTVYRLPSTVHRLPSTVYRLPSTVYRLPSIVYRLSSIVYRLSSIVYRLSSIVHRLPSGLLYMPLHPARFGAIKPSVLLLRMAVINILFMVLDKRLKSNHMLLVKPLMLFT